MGTSDTDTKENVIKKIIKTETTDQNNTLRPPKKAISGDIKDLPKPLRKIIKKNDSDDDCAGESFMSMFNKTQKSLLTQMKSNPQNRLGMSGNRLQINPRQSQSPPVPSPPPVKRKRGRPPKNKVVEPADEDPEENYSCSSNSENEEKPDGPTIQLHLNGQPPIPIKPIEVIPIEVRFQIVCF